MKKYILALLIILLMVCNAFATDGGGQFYRVGPYWDTTNDTMYKGIKAYHYATGTTNNLNCWENENKTTACPSPAIDDGGTCDTTANDGFIGGMYCDGVYDLVICTSTDSDCPTTPLYTETWIRIMPSSRSFIPSDDHGIAYPTASTANRWQMFTLHDASNNFLELGINNGSAFKKVIGSMGYFNVLDAPYSAKCDGSTNDRTAFQSAIDAAYIVSGVVYVPSGTCVISGATSSNPQINLKSGVSIIGASEGQTILKGARLFHTPDVTYTLLGGGITSGAITKGNKTVTLTNVTGISAGDILLFYSSDKVYWATNNIGASASDTNYQAEFLKVLRITGTTLRFAEPFKDSYTAANVKIINMTTEAYHDINIKNLTIDGDNYASANLLPEIGLQNCLDCNVENVEIINMPEYSKSIEVGDIDEVIGTPQPSYNVTLDKIRIETADNVDAPHNLYGVLFSGPVADSKITNSVINSGWHAVAHGGRYIVRNILTNSCTLKGSQWLGHAYDVHTVGADCMLTNSTVDGVYIRGWGQQIVGNTIYNKMNIVPGAPKASIRENHIIVLGTPELEATAEAGWWAFSGADLSDYSAQLQYDIDIEFINNRVEMYGKAADNSKTLAFLSWYAADSTVEATYTGFIITGNKFYDYSTVAPNTGADSWKSGVFVWVGKNNALDRAKFKHIIFKDNYMEGPGTWIRLSNVLANTIDISGNIFEETTYRSTDGLYYGPTYAIFLDSVGCDGDDAKLRVSNNILNHVQGGIYYSPVHDDFDTAEFNNNHITITDTTAGKNGITYLGSIQDGETEVHIKGNTIRGAGLNSSGIVIEGTDITHRVSTAIIEGNSVKAMQASSWYGIETTSVVNNIIIGNRVNGVNTIAAIHARDSANVVISNNVVPAGVIGIITQGDTDLNINGNTIIGVTSDGIKTIDVTNINITGNHIRASGGYGVNITGTTTTPVIYTGNVNRGNSSGEIALPGGVTEAAND